MARPYNAKISLIHVDVNYSNLYTGLIDVNLGDNHETYLRRNPPRADRLVYQRWLPMRKP